MPLSHCLHGGNQSIGSSSFFPFCFPFFGLHEMGQHQSAPTAPRPNSGSRRVPYTDQQVALVAMHMWHPKAPATPRQQDELLVLTRCLLDTMRTATTDYGVSFFAHERVNEGLRVIGRCPTPCDATNLRGIVDMAVARSSQRGVHCFIAHTAEDVSVRLYEVAEVGAGDGELPQKYFTVECPVSKNLRRLFDKAIGALRAPDHVQRRALRRAADDLCRRGRLALRSSVARSASSIGLPTPHNDSDGGGARTQPSSSSQSVTPSESNMSPIWERSPSRAAAAPTSNSPAPRCTMDSLLVLDGMTVDGDSEPASVDSASGVPPPPPSESPPYRPVTPPYCAARVGCGLPSLPPLAPLNRSSANRRSGAPVATGSCPTGTWVTPPPQEFPTFGSVVPMMMPLPAAATERRTTASHAAAQSSQLSSSSNNSSRSSSVGAVSPGQVVRQTHDGNAAAATMEWASRSPSAPLHYPHVDEVVDQQCPATTTTIVTHEVVILHFAVAAATRESEDLPTEAAAHLLSVIAAVTNIIAAPPKPRTNPARLLRVGEGHVAVFWVCRSDVVNGALEHAVELYRDVVASVDELGLPSSPSAKSKKGAVRPARAVDPGGGRIPLVAGGVDHGTCVIVSDGAETVVVGEAVDHARDLAQLGATLRVEAGGPTVPCYFDAANSLEVLEHVTQSQAVALIPRRMDDASSRQYSAAGVTRRRNCRRVVHRLQAPWPDEDANHHAVGDGEWHNVVHGRRQHPFSLVNAAFAAAASGDVAGAKRDLAALEAASKLHVVPKARSPVSDVVLNALRAAVAEQQVVANGGDLLSRPR